eukprot:CAMPEP_0170561570 /NCGR_PEP_ID=MMETSP0211-20121228/55487_1 /TAXON_ID=311385 /ORGANISM="Pseudokeronopsis sp., Strain OXSARD2" /LENGTH=37 /DNA_ID= /DNA_START= /DNA_END= /DNA_ORIENTATION=
MKDLFEEGGSKEKLMAKMGDFMKVDEERNERIKRELE